MRVNLRLLDGTRLSQEVAEGETVAELRSRLEERLGMQHLYRLIYGGRLLRDDDPLAKYGIEERRCVVVMVTKGRGEGVQGEEQEKAQGEEQERVSERECAEVKTAVVETPACSEDLKEESKEEEEIRDVDISTYLTSRTGTEEARLEGLGEYTEEVEENDQEETAEVSEEDREKMDQLSRRLDHLKLLVATRRAAEADYSSESEDSETEPEPEPASAVSEASSTLQPRLLPTGYITHREFTIALEVIMSMEYYTLQAGTQAVITDLSAAREMVEQFFLDNSDLPGVRDTVLDRLEEVVAARPSTQQLEALLSDLCSIYCQEREQEGRSYMLQEQLEEEEEEDMAITDTFASNLADLVGMGFIEEEAEFALRASYNHPCMAVDYLVSGVPPSAFPPEEDNPLAFLRSEPEFQHIRVLVQNNPASLQSLLLAFGQQHPALMDTIHSHKAVFVRMLHEPAGARGLGDDQGLVADVSRRQGR